MEFNRYRVAGTRPLPYFIGSGAAARSYILSFDNFLYEAPATYYTGNNRWDLSPGYDRHQYPFLTRPVVPSCLQCHASGVQAVLQKAVEFNPLFGQPGQLLAQLRRSSGR